MKYGVLLIATLWACAESPLPATGETLEREIYSMHVNDTFVLRIRLPPNFSNTQSYPLIIQLDPSFAGLQQFEHTVGLVSAFDGPDSIVVGVDYDNASKRFRDYALPEPLSESFSSLEGADAFYAALRDEVIPNLEESFSIDAQRRFLFGHSNGSIFA